jgi:ribosomal protein S8
MITKTTKSKLEKVTINISETEIKEAILEWLVKHGHYKKIDRDKNSSLITTSLELYDDNRAEFIMDYTTKEEA